MLITCTGLEKTTRYLVTVLHCRRWDKKKDPYTATNDLIHANPS